MDRVDRLIMKVVPKPSLQDRLSAGNPYLGKPCMELLDLMCPESPGGYQAPEMRTFEWSQFIYAVICSAGNGGLRE